MNNDQYTLDENQFTSSQQPNLEITDDIRRSWREMAAWVTLFGWIYIVAVLSIIVAFWRAADSYNGVSIMTFVSVLINCVSFGFLSYLSLRFGALVRTGLEREEVHRIESAFSMLRFGFIGTVAIIVFKILYYLLTLIIGVGLMAVQNFQ